jgi:hypothetical protein
MSKRNIAITGLLGGILVVTISFLADAIVRYIGLGAIVISAMALLLMGAGLVDKD